MCEGCLFAAVLSQGGARCHPVHSCVQTRGLLCLLVFFHSLVVSCLDLRKHCFTSVWWSDCDGCHLTLPLKNRNEGVQNQSFSLSECGDSPSANCSSTCPLLLLHSHFNITYLHFQPLSPHQSFPIHWLPSSSPIFNICAGNDLCCCKNMSHFHFHD